jgi:phosphoribosylanthranilate isomerase
MKIKICGIKYGDNLKEIVKLNPDFLGFNFYPDSPRYMGDTLTPEDLAIISPYTKNVGVFVNSDEYSILEIHRQYALDYCQLHGNEKPVFCKHLNALGVKVIKAFGITADFNFNILTEYTPWCDYFLFDTASAKFGGTGVCFDWKILTKYEFNHPFFLSGGIGPDDAEKIRNLFFGSMIGVDINSRFELSPGKKDIIVLRRFINCIRNESRQEETDISC